MTNVLAKKLRLFGKLPSADEEILDEIISAPFEIEAGRNLIREGDRPEYVHIILNGLACRNQFLTNGQRQITAFLLPGDFCDLHVFILGAMDHNISALGKTAFAKVSRAKILALLQRPAIAQALWWATLVDEATLRATVVNVGRRSAVLRIAHLFCELHIRMKVIGLVNDGQYSLPLNQLAIADAVGVTPVHANRSIQTLRRLRMVSIKAGAIKILNVAKLQEFSGFDPNYLHLDGGRHDETTDAQASE